MPSWSSFSFLECWNPKAGWETPVLLCPSTHEDGCEQREPDLLPPQCRGHGGFTGVRALQRGLCGCWWLGSMLMSSRLTSVLLGAHEGGLHSVSSMVGSITKGISSLCPASVLLKEREGWEKPSTLDAVLLVLMDPHWSTQERLQGDALILLFPIQGS